MKTITAAIIYSVTVFFMASSLFWLSAARADEPYANQQMRDSEQAQQHIRNETAEIFDSYEQSIRNQAQRDYQFSVDQQRDSGRYVRIPIPY